MKRLGYFLLGTVCLLSTAGLLFAQSPPPPVGLTAHVTHEKSVAVELNWRILPVLTPALHPIQPTIYKIYRSVDDSTAFHPLNVSDELSYVDRDVNPGHVYYYFVTAVWIFPDSTYREGEKSNTAWAKIDSSSDEKRGLIVGTVTDSLSGQPIPFARVLFFRPARPVLSVPQTIADSVGQYRAELDEGTYLINCRPPVWMDLWMSPLPPYKPEWFKDASEPDKATPVEVKKGTSTTINFDLVRLTLPPVAHVSGTVRDSAGNSLRGALVTIMRTIQELQLVAGMNDDLAMPSVETFEIDGLGSLRGVVWRGVTDSLGHFDALVLAGRAYIAMAAREGYVPQFFDHKNNPADATMFKVDTDVKNIDFNLNLFHPPQKYSLGGVVRDSGNVGVPSRIVVFPLRPHPEKSDVRFGYTDVHGVYTIGRLLAGKYIVLAIPFGKYAPAFYKKGAFGVFRWKEADTVVVAADVNGIDIGVVRIHCEGIARLVGHVRSGGGVIGGANVLVVNADGTVVGYGLTDDTGAYAVEALPAGSLSVLVDREGFSPAQLNVNVGESDFAQTQDFILESPTSVAAPGIVPATFALAQNYPNPFNPSTRIGFALPVSGFVTMKVYNLLGQEITTLVNGLLPAGSHEAVWTGSDAAGKAVASGVYFYRLKVSGAKGTADFTSMRKMILLK